MPNRRCWTEINLEKLKNNYLVYKNLLPETTEIMAVVKADAYGHGDLEVSKYLSEIGVKYFAVSNIDEAIHMRKAGICGHILVLGYTPKERISELVKYDISQTLLSKEYAESIKNSGFNIRCQFAIDTGMRRIGLNADDVTTCEKTIRKYADCFRLEGLFTHLCVADSDEQESVEFTKKQIYKFERIAEHVSDLKLPYRHCLNSAGGLRYCSPSSNLMRLGIILYGLKPDYNNYLPDGIRPVLSWKSVISMIKKVNPGDTIGYGRTYKFDSAKTIGTVPTGYADGYSRQLSNKGWVIINGKKAPIVGRICMDQMTVDLSDIPDVEIGTEVILIGKSGNEMITADDIAHLYGTIGYEVICGISKRVDRYFL